MPEFIPIIERLGSLGILVLMVWREPAIVAAIKDLINGVVDKISAMNDKHLEMYAKQQETERNLIVQRFEPLERGLEKIGESLTSSMQVQNEILHQQNEIRHRIEKLEDKK